MASQAIVKRKLQSVTYGGSGVRNTITIDRGDVLTRLKLSLQYTVTAGSSGPATPLWQCLARLIRKIEIQVNGQDTFFNLSGAHIAARALSDFGSRAYGMESTVVLTGSATATTYKLVLPIALTLPRSRRPDDCALDLRAIDQAILAVTWGDATDLFTTVNGAAVSAVTLNVEGHYLVGADPKQTYMVRAMDQQDISVAATNSNMTQIVDRGSDMFWRSFNIVALQNNVATTGILSGGGLQLYAGSFYYINRDAIQILADVRDAFGIPLSEAVNTQVNDLTEYYPNKLDFLGQSVTTINAGALTGDLLFSFNVTNPGAGTVLSMSREAFRPLRA
jgi:hypothetical protein